MTKPDKSIDMHPVQGKGAAPPPEPKKVTTVRLWKEDIELLERNYADSPGGISLPIRKLVRRLANQIRKDHDIPPKQIPNE